MFVTIPATCISPTTLLRDYDFENVTQPVPHQYINKEFIRSVRFYAKKLVRPIQLSDPIFLFLGTLNSSSTVDRISYSRPRVYTLLYLYSSILMHSACIGICIEPLRGFT